MGGTPVSGAVLRMRPGGGLPPPGRGEGAGRSPPEVGIETLAEQVRAGGRMFVLTGAGVSLHCGIPTYRDRDGHWRRSEPVTGGRFRASSAERRRYWARSMAGWPRFASALPGPAHRALAALEEAGWLECLVTQNVDDLHQRAGSRRVIALHGELRRARCLECGALRDRGEIQDELEARNPGLARCLLGYATRAVEAGAATGAGPGLDARPDGDAEIPDRLARALVPPACGACAGALRPDVVLFGENVPSARVEEAMAALAGASLLLAVGTSLAVWSGFRFCRAAAEQGIPLFLVNPGRTRADSLAEGRVALPAEQALPALARALGASPLSQAPPRSTPG